VRTCEPTIFPNRRAMRKSQTSMLIRRKSPILGRDSLAQHIIISSSTVPFLPNPPASFPIKKSEIMKIRGIVGFSGIWLRLFHIIFVIIIISLFFPKYRGANRAPKVIPSKRLASETSELDLVPMPCSNRRCVCPVSFSILFLREVPVCALCCG